MKRLGISTVLAFALMLSGTSAFASESLQNSNQIEPLASYTYKVTVKTNNADDAGTNSKIQIKLHGSKKDSPWTTLDSAGDDFEQGSTGVYYVTASASLGSIQKIEIKSDGKGNKPGWLPYSFVIQKDTSTWKFYNNKWIGDNGPETVTLTP
ncbi:PLAT/LH2 domain-containing protein [Brevibacillus brevis]|uniref:PLAT/LH2 domain-containing protein n=1 Tax=Brevibacillus brevis TaxID=1393 RepID=UPI000E394936|nr:PLAT/LH2 domain-containing protein [Brevibacillus brevis]RED36054.1 PLAT/LH2 domain-containing protein [Brevibacillus brevis]GEC88540.1 hypothetical protein BBR01nite_08710 [Brevibacillus brevis]VEF88836.1 PLAT/LH2 domain [Brevibacillus brevis]